MGDGKSSQSYVDTLAKLENDILGTYVLSEKYTTELQKLLAGAIDDVLSLLNG